MPVLIFQYSFANFTGRSNSARPKYLLLIKINVTYSNKILNALFVNRA